MQSTIEFNSVISSKYLFILLLFFTQFSIFQNTYSNYSEIIGYVDSIDSPHLVGTKQQYKFYKFYLNNGKRRRIQIVAWNEIEKIGHILSNHIIYIDGAQARRPKNTAFNKRNIHYKLLIRNNTVISKIYEPNTINIRSKEQL
ncbi:hypothetical protein ACFW04_008270 [Cataglyphis niger]